MIVYGLKNCDTCRKALKWLKDEYIAFTFRDIRQENPGRDVIAGWAASVGWEKLLNQRGTTWRGLPDTVKASINEVSAIVLMAEHPALMKRPVILTDDGVIVGFDEGVRSVLCGR
jgi:Spx/MgsR family transcriptional regulator